MASNLPARSTRTKAAADKFGYRKKTMVEISAGKAERNAVEAARRKAKADTAAAKQQRAADGSRRLARIEDAHRRQDIVEDDEMRNPLTRAVVNDDAPSRKPNPPSPPRKPDPPSPPRGHYDEGDSSPVEEVEEDDEEYEEDAISRESRRKRQLAAATPVSELLPSRRSRLDTDVLSDTLAVSSFDRRRRCCGQQCICGTTTRSSC
jgi:hypothetical protein